MDKYREVYITIADFAVLQGMRRLYEGFVIGLGYAFKYSSCMNPINFNGYSHLNNIPPQANRFILIKNQYVNNSPEMVERSLNGIAPNGQKLYVAESGDTFATIAKKYGVSIEMLMKWNKLNDSKSINVGQKLIVSEQSNNLLVDYLKNDKLQNKGLELKSVQQNNTFSNNTQNDTFSNNTKNDNLPFLTLGKYTGLGGMGASIASLYNKRITWGPKYVQINDGGTLIRNHNRIYTSTTKISNKVGKGFFFLSIACDFAAYANDEQTLKETATNIGINGVIYAVGCYCPPAGIILGLGVMMFTPCQGAGTLYPKELIHEADNTRIVKPMISNGIKQR